MRTATGRGGLGLAQAHQFGVATAQPVETVASLVRGLQRALDRAVAAGQVVEQLQPTLELLEPGGIGLDARRVAVQRARHLLEADERVAQLGADGAELGIEALGRGQRAFGQPDAGDRAVAVGGLQQVRRAAGGLQQGVGVAQALALGPQALALARLGRDRVDTAHEVAQVVDQAVGAGGVRLGGGQRAARLGQAVPGVGHRLQAVDLLRPGETVEQRPLHGRARQRTRLVLRDDRDQLLARGGQRRARRGAAAGERAAAAVGGDAAGQDQRLVLLAGQLAHTVEGLAGQHAGRQRERRLHVRLGAVGADQRAVGAAAERQVERAGDDRLARAGLACQHRQPGAELQVGVADHDEVGDDEALEHQRANVAR